MKVAILVDAENISYRYAKLILEEAGNIGSVVCKRIYGDWSENSLSSWRKPIVEYSFNAIQQFQNTKGKNSTDSALIIDAMDLLHEESYQCICIVSSDSDFSKLASRLRESEIFVVGMGEQKTPVSFRSACDKFLYLDVLQKEIEKEKAEAEEQIRKQKKKADTAASSEEESGLNRRVITKEINRLLSSESSEDGWMSLAEVGNKLGQKFPDFDVRNFGFSKLSQFIKSTGKYELKGEVSEANPLSKVYYIRRKQ